MAILRLTHKSTTRSRGGRIAYYGHDVDFRQALTGKVAAPAEAKPFLHAIAKDFRDAREGDTDAAAH